MSHLSQPADRWSLAARGRMLQTVSRSKVCCLATSARPREGQHERARAAHCKPDLWASSSSVNRPRSGAGSRRHTNSTRMERESIRALSRRPPRMQDRQTTHARTSRSALIRSRHRRQGLNPGRHMGMLSEVRQATRRQRKRAGRRGSLEISLPPIVDPGCTKSASWATSKLKPTTKLITV